jgi:hypothetical protein
MNTSATLLFFISATAFAAADDDITWLLTYDGKTLPQTQGWTPVGDLASGYRVVDGALRIADDSPEKLGCFRATWKPDPDCETIVEARVRVASVTARKGGTSMWPWVDGAPIGLLVSDGRHQEGLVLRPEKVSNFLDRVAKFDARRNFHTYRLVIRGNDMSIYVDGERKIRGEGAFWKPAGTAGAFVQFGSNTKPWLGSADWSSVRLGIRRLKAAPEIAKLQITLSEPWEIRPPEGIRCTRPYLYNVGQGVLLMSVAQGPDKFMEPYGVLRSTDEGKTWTPVEGLQQKTFAPQPMIRLADGAILGVSRWSVRYDDGLHVGMSYRFDPAANRFTMFESRIETLKDTGLNNLMMFERQIFAMGGGRLLVSVRNRQRGPSTRPVSESFLMQSEDGGHTWTHFSTIGPGGEPTVARLSETEMTAVLRTSGAFEQRWSGDGGRTWGPPVTLEEGSVDADLTMMSHGVLACSYGRPGSNLMFSINGGKDWIHHRVITAESGFNYTSVQEVRPGRLLYVHDAPKLRALYVDVERVP